MQTRIRVFFIAVMCVASVFIAGCGGTLLSPPVQGTDSAAGAGVVVHFIDVGQGDAVLIRTPHKTVLIDSGDISNNKKEHPVVTYVKNLGISELDAVILTHPHADHIGGMQAVFAACPVKQVYDSGQVTTSQLYKHYLQTIKRKRIPYVIARAGMVVDLDDGVRLEFLHPREPLMTETDSDLNNNSLVARLVCGNVSFLFAGDVEKEAENILLQRPDALKSTILKVGHHGSSTSSTSEFIKAVAPETAIIMCGVNNDYHHPHASTLNEYTLLKVNLYRTDLHGSVVVATDGQQYTVKEEKQYGANKSISGIGSL